MNRLAVVFLLLAGGVAQQPGDALLPSALPQKISATGGLTLTLESAFRAHTLKGESFAYVTFSPDGKMLATGTSDGTARLWTLAGEPRLRVENGNMVFKVRFDASGERFLTAVYDGTAKLWDRDGQLLRTYAGHRSAVTDALFLERDAVATGSDDGAVVVFDGGGKELARVTQRGVARNQATSPDGKQLACGFDSGAVRVTDERGKVLHAFESGQGRINDVRFSPDGSRLLTSGFDGTARLWTLDGKPLADLKVTAFKSNPYVVFPVPDVVRQRTN